MNELSIHCFIVPQQKNIVSLLCTHWKCVKKSSFLLVLSNQLHLRNHSDIDDLVCLTASTAFPLHLRSEKYQICRVLMKQECESHNRCCKSEVFPNLDQLKWLPDWIIISVNMCSIMWARVCDNYKIWELDQVHSWTRACNCSCEIFTTTFSVSFEILQPEDCSALFLFHFSL